MRVEAADSDSRVLNPEKLTQSPVDNPALPGKEFLRYCLGHGGQGRRADGGQGIRRLHAQPEVAVPERYLQGRHRRLCGILDVSSGHQAHDVELASVIVSEFPFARPR